jgi:PHD/YefM family antitoxin component YafN of YafNO toxin-antitoxin module
MTAAPFPTSLDHLAELIDQVTARHEPVLISRGDKQTVLMALADYRDVDTTASLLSTSANGKRLEGAVSQSLNGTLSECPVSQDQPTVSEPFWDADTLSLLNRSAHFQLGAMPSRDSLRS